MSLRKALKISETATEMGTGVNSEAENVVDSMVSQLKCSGDNNLTINVNFPQEQDLDAEVVQSLPRKSDTDRIMSYIAKATKSLAKETVSMKYQKTAIQREFNSSRGLGDERERAGTRAADRIRALSATTAPPIKVCARKGKVSLRVVAVYMSDIFRSIFTTFLSVILNLIPFQSSKKKN